MYSPKVTPQYLALCLALARLATTRRISVTSWWRTDRHNEKVGGLTNSRHLIGLGVDIVLDPGEDRAAVIADARELGLQVVDEGDHVHLELDPLN